MSTGSPLTWARRDYRRLLDNQHSSGVGIMLVSPAFGFDGSFVPTGVPLFAIAGVDGTGGSPVVGSTAAAFESGCRSCPKTAVSAVVITVSIAARMPMSGLVAAAGPNRASKKARIDARSASLGAPATKHTPHTYSP